MLIKAAVENGFWLPKYILDNQLIAGRNALKKN